MKHVPYARKRRQLKLLVKQLKVLLRQENAHNQVQNLVIKIRTLSLELSQKLGIFQLKKILGSAVIILGISFSNPVSAQNFAPPVENPFGIEANADALEKYVSFPELADLDDDGDYDLLVGYREELIYFENTGTQTQAVFPTVQINPFGLSDVEHSSPPALADLDNDGDLDLLLSNLNDLNIYYYENIGTAETPLFGERQTNPFGFNFTSSEEAPLLLALDIIDLDNDGDLDVMIGSGSGTYENSYLNYYENVGSPEVPQFSEQQVDPFGLQSVITLGLSPEFIDIDFDGDLDLLIKDFSYGNYFFAKNIGTPENPIFDNYETNIFGLIPFPDSFNGSVTSADMDNDGDTDLIATQAAKVFQGEAPILYRENIPTRGVSVSTPTFESNIAPNPVQDWLKIDSEKELESIQIFDITGRSISLITNIAPSIYLGNLDSGVYLLELTSTDGKRVSKKIEKL